MAQEYLRYPMPPFDTAFIPFGGDGSDGARTDSANATITDGIYQYTTWEIETTYTITIANVDFVYILVQGDCTITGDITANGAGRAGGAAATGGVQADGGVSASSLSCITGGGGGGGASAAQAGGDGGGGHGTGGAGAGAGAGDGANASIGYYNIMKCFLNGREKFADCFGGGGGGGGGGTGGAGGAGGGLIYIECGNLIATGDLTAVGDDGAAPGVNTDGGGGGGGGGAIIVRAQTIASNTGTHDASGGEGGLSGGAGGDGGAGADGFVLISRV